MHAVPHKPPFVTAERGDLFVSLAYACLEESNVGGPELTWTVWDKLRPKGVLS